MKKKRFLYSVTIVAITLFSIGGLTAFSTNAKLLDNVYEKIGGKIRIDGMLQTMEDEYTVLNYKNRTYYPIRFIAEKMGAEVKWDDWTGDVDIQMPASFYETEIVEAEKIVYKEIPVYKYLPRIEKTDDVSIEVDNFSFLNQSLSLDVIIDAKSKNAPMLLYKNVYVELEDGMKIELETVFNDSVWYNSLLGETKGHFISRNQLDDDIKLEDVEHFKLVIPVEFEDSKVDRKKHIIDYTYYIRIDLEAEKNR